MSIQSLDLASSSQQLQKFSLEGAPQCALNGALSLIPPALIQICANSIFESNFSNFSKGCMACGIANEALIACGVDFPAISIPVRAASIALPILASIFSGNSSNATTLSPEEVLKLSKFTQCRNTTWRQNKVEPTPLANANTSINTEEKKTQSFWKKMTQGLRLLRTFFYKIGEILLTPLYLIINFFNKQQTGNNK